MAVERKQTSSLLIDIALYAASAVISFVLLNNVLKKLDPNHENAKQVSCASSHGRAYSQFLKRSHTPWFRLQAQVKKKELSKRLGRPLLDTNQYEDVRTLCARAAHFLGSRRDRTDQQACVTSFDVLPPVL